jgi:hypothetical protein
MRRLAAIFLVFVSIPTFISAKYAVSWRHRDDWRHNARRRFPSFVCSDILKVTCTEYRVFCGVLATGVATPRLLAVLPQLASRRSVLACHNRSTCLPYASAGLIFRFWIGVAAIGVATLGVVLQVRTKCRTDAHLAKYSVLLPHRDDWRRFASIVPYGIPRLFLAYLEFSVVVARSPSVFRRRVGPYP